MTELRKLVIQGSVDSNNSSSTPLGVSGVFTGTATNILNIGFIFVTVFSDVASATDGLSVQQSSDGTNWDNTDVFTVPAGTGKTYSFQPGAKWLRVVYTNGGVGQAAFRLQTVLKGTSSKPSSHRIQDIIIDEDDAELAKAVVTGLSDITSAFENVTTYRGALQVDEALVHQIAINEHFRQTTGASTTLSVAPSAGDTAISVASVAGISVGDLLTIFNTAQREPGHFHVISVADPVVTLSRPLDNAYDIGDSVKEIVIDMAVSGTLASPVVYRVTPASYERFQLTRILMTMLDSTSMDDGKFGGLTALTNGVVLRINNGGTDRTITHWQSNGDMKDDMFDVAYADKAPAGQFGLSARMTFTKAEFIADLDGAASDYIEILIQDDLTGLDNFNIKIQGRLFGG